MESTAKSNSRVTHVIVSKNIVMADAWNRQYKLSHFRPRNHQRKLVTTDLETISKNLFTVDKWNREQKLINGSKSLLT
jgi:hypothetical protein